MSTHACAHQHQESYRTRLVTPPRIARFLEWRASRIPSSPESGRMYPTSLDASNTWRSVLSSVSRAPNFRRNRTFYGRTTFAEMDAHVRKQWIIIDRFMRALRIAQTVMGRACCVLGCSSGGDAPSHQIPKNPELFQKWKSMIYSEKIQHLNDEQIGKCAVCYRHFADDDYLLTYRVRKLKRGVAPSLNLPNGPDKKNMMTKSNGTCTITDISTKAALTVPVEETIKEEDTFVVKLFEDLPETLESYLHEDPQELKVPENISEQQFDMHADDASSIYEICETNLKSRALKRTQIRLTEEQSILVQRKKRAEKYAKTPTIQKLLSLVKNTEKLSLQNRIRRSKYSPKMYIQLYHDIAKRKAFGQL